MPATALALRPDLPAERPPAISESARTGLRLLEHRADSLGRRAAEAFIRRRFAEAYGARVEHFMPRLFTVADAEGRVCGAFGLRPASSELFLEAYLDVPVEQAIARHAGLPVARRHIVEVGHFAGAAPGAVRAMIALLAGQLSREGFRWVVFTGTTGLRNAFDRLGLAPVELASAEASRLPKSNRDDWGSYYDHGPRVAFGCVGEGCAVLSRRRGVQ